MIEFDTDTGEDKQFHINVEQCGIRNIMVTSEEDVSVFDLHAVFSRIERLLMRLDGTFIALSEIGAENKEIREEGKVWPRWNLKKADNFWFIQILSLAKLKRGDYLIADHLANMQINETLVAQMLERDNYHGTTFHRYGYHEDLEYRAVNMSEFLFVEKDETYNMIAHKIYSVALAYNRLIKRSNPEYEERSSLFFEMWK